MKPVTLFSSFMHFLIAFILGGIGCLAYSPFDYWGIAYLSSAGFIYCVIYAPNLRIALCATLVWSIGYFGCGLNWIHISMLQFGGVPLIVSYLAVLLLACYLAIYPLLFCYIVWRFKFSNPWILASLFTLTEYLRGTLFTGFPWLQFGYSQIDSPFAGIAPMFGVVGLNFFVMLTSGYLLQIFTKIATKKHRLSLIIQLFVLNLFAYYSNSIQFVQVDTQKKPLSITLLQGNIPQQLKWDPDYFNFTIHTYQQLLMPHVGKQNIIIFPESVIPAFESQIEPLLSSMTQVSREYGTQFIIGTLFDDQVNGQIYNSVKAINGSEHSNENSLRYNKHHLVPFGEYVPFGDGLNWLRKIFILPTNLAQGELLQSPLELKSQRFALAICYEIIFGDLLQQRQNLFNADYLLTLSNDAWFGDSIGPWQHFQIARMRALELGKPLIRATNTGISAFISHYGKVIAQAPQFESTTLTLDIQTTQGKTLFCRWGNYPAYGLSLVCVMVGMIARQRKHKQNGR